MGACQDPSHSPPVSLQITLGFGEGRQIWSVMWFNRWPSKQQYW